MGLRARFKNPALKEVRYFVLAPPFNNWLVFHKPTGNTVEIKRVLYGTVNWREEPGRLF